MASQCCAATPSRGVRSPLWPWRGARELCSGGGGARKGAYTTTRQRRQRTILTSGAVLARHATSPYVACAAAAAAAARPRRRPLNIFTQDSQALCLSSTHTGVVTRPAASASRMLCCPACTPPFRRPRDGRFSRCSTLRGSACRPASTPEPHGFPRRTAPARRGLCQKRVALERVRFDRG